MGEARAQREGGEGIHLFPITLPDLVESVRHDHTHCSEVVYRPEPARGEVALFFLKGKAPESAILMMDGELRGAIANAMNRGGGCFRSLCIARARSRRLAEDLEALLLGLHLGGMDDLRWSGCWMASLGKV